MTVQPADIARTLATKAAEPTEAYWTDGVVRIPKAANPARASYDERFVELCRETFLRPGERFVPVEVPTTESLVIHANGVRNFDRYEMYLRMLRAGENPPPIIVERVGDRWFIPDGNHRTFAARAAGVKTLPALAVVRTPDPEG